MPIDDAVLLNFVNETVRPLADRIAGITTLLDPIIGAVQGQGIGERLGTTSTLLTRAAEWTETEYGSFAPETITGTDSGGRQLLNAHHVAAVLRVAAFLKGEFDANPMLMQVLGAVAVNPRV